MKEKKQNFYAKVLKPEDLVEYQDGAVVSRMLIYEKAGTISVFAFTAGQGLSEHTAPYDSIVLILEGDASITIGGTEHHVNPREIIILPAQIPHIINAISNCKMMLTLIHE